MGRFFRRRYASRCRLRAGARSGVEGRAAGRGVCSLRISCPTSGLGRRWRRRGAPAGRPELDGEYAFYASRLRPRAWPRENGGGALSWTRSLLPTPLTSDFEPGPEAAAAGIGAQLDGEFCFLCLSPPTSGLARRGQRRRAQLDGEFAFYASRRRLRAWPGGDGRGALSWTGGLLSTPLAAVFGPGPQGAADGCTA